MGTSLIARSARITHHPDKAALFLVIGRYSEACRARALERGNGIPFRSGAPRPQFPAPLEGLRN